MASRRQRAQIRRPPARLYLITPPIEDARRFAADLESALEAADVTAVLLRFAGGKGQDLREAVTTLAPVVQTRGIALLLDGEPELAPRLDADGAHLTGTEALKRAIGSLKPERIAGAGGLKTRHDGVASVFGTSGPSSGPFPAIIERVAWWAELFEPACVGYAGSFEEVGQLVAAGADFVALGDPAWAGEVAAAVRTAAAAMKPVEALE